jgi:uncharacterized protein
MYEWDENKRSINFTKHGLDFIDVISLFNAPISYTVELPFQGEQRFSTTGVVLGRFVTAIWTLREDKIRLISARGARENERRAYRQLHGGADKADDRKR